MNRLRVLNQNNIHFLIVKITQPWSDQYISWHQHTYLPNFNNTSSPCIYRPDPIKHFNDGRAQYSYHFSWLCFLSSFKRKKKEREREREDERSEMPP